MSYGDTRTCEGNYQDRTNPRQSLAQGWTRNRVRSVGGAVTTLFRALYSSGGASIGVEGCQPVLRHATVGAWSERSQSRNFLFRDHFV